MPGWDDILILGAQLDPMPLDEHAPVDTDSDWKACEKAADSGKSGICLPYVFRSSVQRGEDVPGKGNGHGHTAPCVPERAVSCRRKWQAADKYIFEYVGNLYSVTPENLRNADAIEIKIGQGTKPGMGGHLPGEKVTPEISPYPEQTHGKRCDRAVPFSGN